jgi:hypothetical protein
VYAAYLKILHTKGVVVIGWVDEGSKHPETDVVSLSKIMG